MSSSDSKSYGLLIPKKGLSVKGGLGKAAAIFNNENSSDEDQGRAKKAVNADINDESSKKIMTKQTQIEMEKAITEDSTVYQYDEVYDQMEEKKKEANQKIMGGGGNTQEKKAKYINKLMKSAELRKVENERRKERKVLKERDNEGGEFDDKEEFVTSAYRQKMEEQAVEDERVKKQDERDAKNDVTKQKDMSMFYRNLLTKNVAMGGDDKEKQTKKSEKDNSKTKEQANSSDDEKSQEKFKRQTQKKKKRK